MEIDQFCMTVTATLVNIEQSVTVMAVVEVFTLPPPFLTRRGEDRGDKLDEGEWNMEELRRSSVRKGSKLIFALRYVVHEWSYILLIQHGLVLSP